jgi:prepilin-type N-terminal cleavage/methylation domain-containing protein
MRIAANRRNSKGFSLVELLAVIAIILILAVLTTPNILRAVRTYRLTSASREVASLLQRARYDAVRLNRDNPPLLVRTQTIGGQATFWVDANGNGAPDATETQVILPLEIQSLPPGAVPGTASMGLGATTQFNNVMAFNARGTLEFGAAAPTVFVVFLGYPAQRDIGYRAVTITPLARTQTWMAQAGGANWIRQ